MKIKWDTEDNSFGSQYLCLACRKPVNVSSVKQARLGFKCHKGCDLGKCRSCGSQRIADARRNSIVCSNVECEVRNFSTSHSVVVSVTVGGTQYPYWTEKQYEKATGKRLSILYTEFESQGRKPWGTKKPK